MKTKNFIPTLLALIIRVMVTGQTQEMQSQYRILNVLGGKQPSSPSIGAAKKQVLKEKSEAALKDKTSNPASSEKVWPTLISEEKNNEVSDNNIYNFYNNPACYTTRAYANELLKQADELLTIEQSLRSKANGNATDEKIQLTNAANSLRQQAELKQIQASEISGKLNTELFRKNETLFSSLILKVTKETVIEQATSLNEDAIRTFKLASEMRQEAYSIASNAAKLGMMSNAEEKETTALEHQQEAIQSLKNAIAASYMLYPGSDLASR